MASYPVRFVATTGQTLSAYPRYTTAGAEISFSTANAAKVACVEDPFSVYSIYDVTVTDAYDEWWIMPTSASSWSEFSGINITFETLIESQVIATSLATTGTNTSLIAYKDEVPTFTVTVPDTDMSTMDLEFVIENQEQTDIVVVDQSDLEGYENYFTVTIPNTVTDEIGTYRWSLRNITSPINKVISFGILSVNYAASNDS